MSDGLWIRDGYNRKAYIEPVHNLHPGLRFTYRPVPIEEASEFFERGAALKAREADRKTAALLRSKVKSWDLRATPDGDLVEITEANILRINRVLFGRMLGIVLGTQAADDDPEASEQERDEAIRDKGEANGPVGLLREERDQKN